MADYRQHIYIIGSKGIPAKYGGFETFVEKLTEYKSMETIQYHVACMNTGDHSYGEGKKHFQHNQADCFNIDVPNVGPARAIYYDLKALAYALALAEKNKDNAPVFYVLACRIGPFIKYFKKRIEKIGGKLYVNPDGHEWLRAKWSYPVRKYWKYSEKLMVKHADLLICDSLNIEKYIIEEYQKFKPATTYISYGAEVEKSVLKENDEKVVQWFKEHDVQLQNYFLVVGRFVPENNYETMIQEFMKSDTQKDLVLITNIEKNKFYAKLQKETQFEKDKRIKFVGTVYDQELLKLIREKAFGYIHGHEVGGTNPSLLEALSLTKLNLLLDVGFNHEVGRECALYWKKDASLSQWLNQLENSSFLQQTFANIGSREHIRKDYSWSKIVSLYESLWVKNK
jgi:rhamnosyltransferase